MFLYFIFVVFAVVAIIVTVKLLHNNQQRALQARANEDLSLPPVDPDSIPERQGLEWEDDSPVAPASGDTDHTQPPETREIPAVAPEYAHDDTPAESVSQPEPESTPKTALENQINETPAFELKPTPDPLHFKDNVPSAADDAVTKENPQAIDWKEQVQALKNAGQFDDALRACQAGWPQWQSYQQAAIVCRAAMKQANLSEDDIESWQEALYLLATHASFLHDKVPGMKNLSWQRLEKTLAVEDLRDLESHWQKMGYEAFRLLNKTDVRMLVKAWGEPASHQSAKRYYKKHFMSITSS